MNTEEKKPENPPAFPCEVDYTKMISSNASLTEPVKFAGMSLRDYFAAKAMQTVVIDNEFMHNGITEEKCAILAYKLADAMLKEREPKKQINDNK